MRLKFVQVTNLNQSDSQHKRKQIQSFGIRFDTVDIEENDVSFAVKADVTNIKKDDYDDEDVTVEIQGVDIDGFEILTVYLSGKVAFNMTKTLTDRTDYQDKDEFEQVVKWQFVDV
ncbi:hypothetical protein WAI17_06100 [Acinetobacter baumannii]|uniref:hypothetical protein n=1 Tax=Acinetobacter calcoaceticus/baumannii complex TaxID=909768 RepID=UPI001D0D793A|nr:MULTISPECIES: hypothetical protein [Acinetobacter calcoaceticus/baumannii complex]MDA3512753.1 hypothetical protein [Acinetobacter baumannii]MDA3515100.1 hypothetical protein [Acinetobacter baumannii]MDX8205355.1 hypothetical protein [Acinetobacter pittii]MDX8231185.1 hypothetical protein [Acinetobacter pittii]WPP81350.1 hypothetical protein SOI79_02235 [Acinetobacter pittii]